VNFQYGFLVNEMAYKCREELVGKRFLSVQHIFDIRSIGHILSTNQTRNVVLFIKEKSFDFVIQ
jgi:hypothetical protein